MNAYDINASNKTELFEELPPGIQIVALMAAQELARALQGHHAMRSYHEGKAVIEEEVEELWDEIKMKHPDRSKVQAEAIQVAAMGMRFVLDLTQPL